MNNDIAVSTAPAKSTASAVSSISDGSAETRPRRQNIPVDAPSSASLTRQSDVFRGAASGREVPADRPAHPTLRLPATDGSLVSISSSLRPGPLETVFEDRSTDTPASNGGNDAIITRFDKAKAYLASATATGVFAGGALGISSNLADYLAPSVVDGISDPLSRNVAAAAFSGAFLGLTSSVFGALGADLANEISDVRQNPNSEQNQVSNLEKLSSAVKRATLPATAGFGTGFVLAAYLDKDSDVLADPDINAATMAAKLGRAVTAGALVGLAAEFSKHASSDFSFSRSDQEQVFGNIRKLGESIKQIAADPARAPAAFFQPQQGGPTEFGNILGGALGFAAFTGVASAVSKELSERYGDDSENVLADEFVQTAVSLYAGIAAFVIADQMVRNSYSSVIQDARPSERIEELTDDIPDIRSEGEAGILEYGDAGSLEDGAQSTSTKWDFSTIASDSTPGLRFVGQRPDP